MPPFLNVELAYHRAAVDAAGIQRANQAWTSA
jgi:hypothetical protein